MERKTIPERFSATCQNHAIYCTGSISDLPGAVPETHFSLTPSRDTSRMRLEMDFCQFCVFWGVLMGTLWVTFSCFFSIGELERFSGPRRDAGTELSGP